MMDDGYRRAKDLFKNELMKIVDKGDMSPANLEFSYKLVDIIKDIDEICEKEEDMYDSEYSGRGYSMRRSRSYYPAPYMGEYAVEGRYGRGYSNNYNGNYDHMSSRNNSSALVPKLQKMMEEATTDHEKMMIRSWMDELVG